MAIERGLIEDSSQFAQVYLEAFPESREFFFPSKSEHKLLDLVSLSFKLLFHLGGQALVIKDDQGEIVAYCLYKSALKLQKKAFLPLFTTGIGALFKLNPLEASRLALTKVMIFCTTKKEAHFRHHQATGEILSIAVHPLTQGEGLGKALLEASLNQMAGEGVILNVRSSNLAARHLYEQAGFVQRGSNRDLLGEWLMLIKPAI